jgi:hypothetical protein
MLTNVIRESKRSTYHNQIINSASKIKTTWNMIKSVSSRQNEHRTSKQRNSPDSCNKFFLSIAKKKLVIILTIVVGKTTALIIQNITYKNYLLYPSPI